MVGSEYAQTTLPCGSSARACARQAFNDAAAPPSSAEPA